MEKVERDGKVAVLYSPGYGAGWSTWADNDIAEAMCMDARIVQPMLDGGREAAIAAALAIFPDIYTGGGHDLEVVWIDKGAAFEVSEYDGSESIRVIDHSSFMVA